MKTLELSGCIPARRGEMIHNKRISHVGALFAVVVIGIVFVGCTGAGEEPTEDSDFAITTPQVEANAFTYPAYSIADLAAVPAEIGTAYTTFSDDPASPHFAHREKPLTSEYTAAQLAQLKRAFQVAWHYYSAEIGIDLGEAMGPDALTGVQADGLVHKWNQNWLVQNLVDGDNALGDPWDMGLSALLITRLTLPDPSDPDSWEPPPVYVITNEVLLDYDRGPNETGTPLENLGNTRAGRQIFEKGLYDVNTPNERAIWKIWETEE